MYVIQRRSKFSSLLTAIFLIIFLAGCSSGVMPATENNVHITETQLPLPTKTVLAPTEIVSPTSKPPEADYFSLSVEQRIELSKALAEKANGFSGEVILPIELNGKVYNFYWDPTAVDQYETDAIGGWKLEQQNPNVDKTGESLPDLVFHGYENADGSLVVVDPVTGQQTVYANPNIPALGGVISYRDLFNMSQAELSKLVTDAGLSFPPFGTDPDESNRLTKLQEQSLYIPVILYGEQTAVYAIGAGNGGSKTDIPEEGYSAYQVPTNNALIPIYSPETGDFMFFINMSAGNARRTMTITYDTSGNIDGSYATVGQNDSFGHNQQDEFGIIVQSRHTQVAHNLGGGEILIENSPAVGDINVVEEVFSADTEVEIQDILDAYRLLVAYPSIVFRPER